MSISIHVTDLSFWYGKQQALKSVNLDAREKEVTALIGPSGCGKTTLLRCINMLFDLYSNVSVKGKISLGSENIMGKNVDKVSLRKRIGMIFQKPNPFPHLSIFENVACGIRLHALANGSELSDRVENCLKKASLWDEVKDKLNQSGTFLSGGQQQRLCIARAMAIEPEVFLMDEPCASLDPASTMNVEELIKDLKKQYTILIVTHNMQQAARISDRAAFMLNGELIESDNTSDLFVRAKDKRTEDYITGKMG